jgi:hypothetical protein
MVSRRRSDEEFLVILVLVAVLGIRRTYRMATGASASPGRLAAVTGFYLVIFALAVVEDLYAFPFYFLFVEVALLVAGAIVTALYVRRVVTIAPHPTWGYSYRLGYALPLVYLGLFLVRIAVDVFVVGLPTVSPTGAVVTPTVTGLTLDLVAAVDALFSVSAGIVTGRSIGVYLALRENRAQAKAPLPSQQGPG